MKAVNYAKFGCQPSKLSWFFAFAALSWLGNYFSLPLGFNVDFIFGSIFGLMAVVMFGPIMGSVASLAGASYTFLLWNHPYAIIIFTCEAIWLGGMKRKHPERSIVTIDLLYWLFFGTPLVLLFYFGVMDLGVQGTAIIALKQSVNGLTNAILASVLLSFSPLWRQLSPAVPPVRSMAHTIFEATAFLLLIPCIGGLFYMNHLDLQKTQKDLATRIRQSGNEAAWLINDWLAQHLLATQRLVENAAALNFKTSTALQHEVAVVHSLFPQFHNMFISDENATTLAFDPMINERGESTIGINFSDRQWFKRLKESKKPVISDVFTGRGGVFEPIVTISSPHLRNGELIGFALGAINLFQLQSYLRKLADQTSLSFTLTDKSESVIISTDPGRTPLAKFNLPAPQFKRKIIKSVFLNLPETQKNVTAMQPWKKAGLFSVTQIGQTGWTVVTEGPLAPLQQEIYGRSIKNLGAISLLLLLTCGVSILMSRRLSRPLHQLSRVSADIPGKIESGTSIVWPSVETLEIAVLIANFRTTADDLRDKFQSLQQHSHNLENMVAERTVTLEKSIQEEERSRTLLQTFYDLAPIAIAWTDQDMVFKYQNRRFVELTGYDMQKNPSLLSWAMIAYPDKEYREKIDKKRKQVREEVAGAGQFEVWITHKNGSKCCSQAHFNRMPDGKYLIMFADITERKNDEERLNAYAKAQSVLLQEVNHRVKNNLALLVGMLNLENKRHSTQGHKTFLVDIIGRIQALSTVHSLLSTSEWKPIRLSELCGQIISNSLSNGKTRRIAIASSTITIEATQAHNIALVINELATNSAKYADDKEKLEVAIEISACAEEIAIIFRDNGPGYPEAQIRDELAESGIGLQMVRGIVEMSLYGTVSFANQDGAQTTIRLKRVK